MIKILNIEHSDQRQKLIATLNIDSQTWLVADINTKNKIQSQLLERISCLPEDAVLRASELWQKILRQNHPDFELASTQLISTLLSEWLHERDLKWASHPGTAQILVRYIGELLPILPHETLIVRVREWLRENPEALMRWGHWYELSVEAWLYFCKEKILAVSWISAFLSAQESSRWSRDVFVDLGPDLAATEIDLLRNLSREHDITIIAPTDKWLKKYYGTLWPYEVLSNRSVKREPPQITTRPSITKNLNCYRFTTQIAEVKAATAQVRTWLAQGVPAERIGVLAANIESYWPALESYLSVEGVGTQKDLVASVVSLPALGRWLARLRIECREIESGHLETAIYGGTKVSVHMEYEKFEQLFSRIYEDIDLNRNPSVRELFHFQFSPKDKLTRDEFFVWSLQFWSNDPRGLDRVMAEMLLECPKGFLLNLSSWVSYLAAIIAKAELKLREGNPCGIHCINFDVAQNLNLQNIILLGLSESNLRENFDLSINLHDVQKLALDLGVFINSPDSDYNEYLVHHLAESTEGEICLYFSATDFSGQAQAPSLIWLQAALAKNYEIEKYIAPPPTRWDERQQAPLADVGFGEIESYVMQDLGVQNFPDFIPVADLRFSPSQIEKYLKCPFIFGAEKLFKLSDLPDVDLDIDAMTGGRILHALLDKLLSDQTTLNYSDIEISNIVDQVKALLAVPVGDERLWPAKREHFVRIGRNFLSFERDWRAKFSHLQTVGRELRLRGEMVLDDNLKIKVSGQIDRIDAVVNEEANEYAIIDYKSSGWQLHNHGSWLANDELQLAFYAIAISEGLTELKKGPVVGAFYYTLSNMNREKGYRLQNHENKLFEPNTKNRSQLSQEELFMLLGEVKTKIAEVVRCIQKGKIQPKPHDVKICGECHWRTLCRSPHLN